MTHKGKKSEKCMYIYIYRYRYSPLEKEMATHSSILLREPHGEYEKAKRYAWQIEGEKMEAVKAKGEEGNRG